jgi:hypothetical protein
MLTAAEYRQYAQECMDNARAANDEAVRIQFLQLARLWLAAATQLELRKKGDGATTWPGIDRPSQNSPDSS